MPTDEDLILAVNILKAVIRLGKGNNTRNIQDYIIKRLKHFANFSDVLRVASDLAKENLLNETQITKPDGKPDFIYGITVDGYSKLSILDRAILEKKKNKFL